MASSSTLPGSADVSTLAWVLEELRKALDSANKSLRRFLREKVALGAGIVIALLLQWQRPVEAVVVGAFLAGQLVLMGRFLRDPVGKALFYSGFGVPLFVFGMMASAVAVRSLPAGF